MSTIFTKIINKEIPADILYENDSVIAFRDVNPQAPIHFLVIPKKEIPTLNDIEDDDKDIIGELFLVAKKVQKKNGLEKKVIERFLIVMKMVVKQCFTYIYM